MNAKRIVEYIRESYELPEPGSDEHEEWLSMDDVLSFLKSTTSTLVPLYLSGRSFFVNAVFVPEDLLSGEYVEDIRGWSFSVSGGWGWGEATRDDGVLDKAMFPPLAHTSSDILGQGEAPVFLRYFEGRKPHGYIEIDQRFSHVLEMHWVPDRSAYCVVDENGDLRDVLLIHRDEDVAMVAIEKEYLDFYLWLRDFALVRMFDVARSRDWPLGSDRRDEARVDDEGAALFSDLLRIYPDNPDGLAAKLRGFQIVRRTQSGEDLVRQRTGDGRDEKKEYESFIINDWKNKRVLKWPSCPSELSNYFVESDLPFETSPAFFNVEVLSRYRQDPDKYTMSERQIECRGGWGLTFDINDEGQVHVYIYELGRLPEREQKYWRTFNEKPKSGLSERAIKTDFRAEFDLTYNPLQSLVECLKKFPSASHRGESVFVWKPRWDRRARAFERLSYVVVGSRKEWEDQVLELAKVVVDGFSVAALRTVAAERGVFNPDDEQDRKLGSLGLLKRCLEAANMPGDEVAAITGALREVQALRSRVAAHAGGEAAQGSLGEAHRELVTKVDKAMRSLSTAVDDGAFNLEGGGDTGA